MTEEEIKNAIAYHLFRRIGFSVEPESIELKFNEFTTPFQYDIIYSYETNEKYGESSDR